MSEVLFVLLGDEGYALLPYLMSCTQAKPGHQNFIFNYRLSRAKRSIDCAFGIMLAKWKRFCNTLKQMSLMQPQLSKLYASFIILCWNMVELIQFPEGQSKFSWPAQHCFSIVPRVWVKNSELLYQCEICAMLKWLCFAWKWFTVPQYQFASHISLIVNYHVQHQYNWMVG